MTQKKMPPSIAASEFKKTKIIATVGPATNSYESIYELIHAGANGLRLNFSHATYDDSTRQIGWIRKAAKALNKPVAVIQDLQGPKIRLGNFEGIIAVEVGQHLQLKYNADHVRSGLIPTQYDLSKKVKRGERVLLFDGKIRTTVTTVKDDVVHVRVDSAGVLLERKGINLPDTDLSNDVITEKDIKDIQYGASQEVDYIAQSFVQTSQDIESMRRHIRNAGGKAKIIAKIETSAALENIESIVEAADAVMIARGDLAVETANEVVPIAQRKIVGLCRVFAKPVIIATQMMSSMIDADEPTRAEVSDVATAAIIGADCVMLSDESAMGKFPSITVATMKRVLLYAERNQPALIVFNSDMAPKKPNGQTYICNAVVDLAKEVQAEVIVAETKSGATALQVSARRPNKAILAVTSQRLVANQLAIAYGVKSFVRPDDPYAATKLTDWLVKNKVLEKGSIIVTASGKHPGVIGTTDTIKVRAL